MNFKWKELPIKRTPQTRAYEEAVRRGMKNQHVVKADDGWAVKSGGAERASRVFATQEKAVRHAQNIAKNKNSDVIIHGRNGRIQRRVPA